MTAPLDTLEALCRDGASFEEALEQIGFADSPMTITAQIFKYWQLLEIHHAFNASKSYFERMLAEGY
jgi:hypothetical protein